MPTTNEKIEGWGGWHDTDDESIVSLWSIREVLEGHRLFCLSAYPMTDDVTLQRRLPLAGAIYRMIHEEAGS